MSVLEKKISRRNFLFGAMNMGRVAAVAYLKFQLASISFVAQEQLSDALSRKSNLFVWPDSIQGNESFFENDILITIDDCYDIESTKAMVTLLEENGAKATFFPNTEYLDLDKYDVISLWRDIYEKEFDIGYHTIHHVSGMTQSELEADFTDFTDHMRKLLNDPSFAIQFVRPPGGNWNEDWMNWVRAHSLTNVKWNFVPNARNGSVEYFEAVTKNEKGGSIILLHPRHFDVNWLTTHFSELEDLAAKKSGAIACLRGNT